nr:MAG TPA: hypothetical protein [Caudoviricetes sp.]
MMYDQKIERIIKHSNPHILIKNNPSISAPNNFNNFFILFHPFSEWMLFSYAVQHYFTVSIQLIRFVLFFIAQVYPSFLLIVSWVTG